LHAGLVDVVLEGELRGMDPYHEQSVVLISLRPGPHERFLTQSVDARERPEVEDDDVAV
jgi:hypothetical protein